jgi:SAM-dependent methyltransferase
MIEDIRVLFLDENKEKVWETDYIVDTLLPSDKNKELTFSPTIENVHGLFDVLVFNCRKKSFNEIINIVNIVNPKIIIQLSDEYKNEDLNHYNRLSKYCNLYLRQYHHEGYEYFENTAHIPLGYCNDAGLDFMDFFPDSFEKIPKIKNRSYNWGWVGDMKNDRWEMLDKFSQIHSHTYATNTSKDDMIERYLQSKFVPCGRGNSTLDCYRLYEASMCGSIPCVVGSVNEISQTFKYEESPPWILGRSWDEVVHKCKLLLHDEEKLQEVQNEVLKWWHNRIMKINKKVSNSLNENRIDLENIEDEIALDHYWQDDSIFGENWFSYPNLYKNVVNLAKDGDIFVEVGAWKGRSTSCLAVEIANSKKDITLYVIDTWEGSIEHLNNSEKESLPTLYETFMANMKPVEKYYFPLKMTSEEASKKFKDKSLKFVFLDASHEYEDVKRDIQNWISKVKPGGILAGHDYYPDDGRYDWFPGVKQAVNETIKDFDISELCFIHNVIDDNKIKFEGFPSVNYISIEETEDRRNILHKKFEEYGIENVTPRIYKRYNDEEHKIESQLLHRLSIGSRGPVTSHLKAIKEWYYETNEPYTFICEDDLGFQTVKYWNFTWKEFFNSLPEDWECVQLCLLREDFHRFSIGFRNRCWCDWSGCAYLISREHARKLVETYYPNDTFTLDYVGQDMFAREEWARIPVIETIIYSNFGKVYSFPLFVEDIQNCPSSYFNATGIRTGETDHHHQNSFNISLEWWRSNAQFKTIDQLKVI